MTHPAAPSYDIIVTSDRRLLDCRLLGRPGEEDRVDEGRILDLSRDVRLLVGRGPQPERLPVGHRVAAGGDLRL